MCSLPSMISSRSSTRASRGRGFSTDGRRKSGSHWSVTSVTTPRAPKPTRAHANPSGSSSAEQRNTSPPAVTSSSAVTNVASPPKRFPPPWVAVAIAPEIDWRSISPRLERARPRVASSSFSFQSGMPPSTVTVRASESSATTRSRRSRCKRRPSVQAMSVKEWPAPATLTAWPALPARRTASATSSSLSGRSTAAGVHDWLRPQFRQRFRSRTAVILRPAQVAQPVVVDAEVVADLVDHRDPDLAGEVGLVARPFAQRSAEDRDLVRHDAGVVDRRAIREVHAFVQTEEGAGPASELLGCWPVLHDDDHVLDVRGQIGWNGIERVTDELFEAGA